MAYFTLSLFILYTYYNAYYKYKLPTTPTTPTNQVYYCKFAHNKQQLRAAKPKCKTKKVQHWKLEIGNCLCQTKLTEKLQYYKKKNLMRIYTFRKCSRNKLKTKLMTPDEEQKKNKKITNIFKLSPKNKLLVWYQFVFLIFRKYLYSSQENQFKREMLTYQRESHTEALHSTCHNQNVSLLYYPPPPPHFRDQ